MLLGALSPSLSILLSSGAEILFINIFAISSPVLAQTSITLLYLSPSVISPCKYWFLILLTSSSASLIDLFFSSGIIISAIETEIPEVVECLKPNVLSLSASNTVALPPDILNVVSIKSSTAFFVINLFIKSKGTSSGITSKIKALPTVVSLTSSLIFIFILA